MKKYLLDTHVLLWWLDGDKRLDDTTLGIINNPNNIKFVSVASFWEIVIKIQTKKFLLSVPIEKVLEKFEFDLLEIGLDHVLKVTNLPDIHKDPFDRILVAQSLVEECELITSDSKIKKYF